MTSQLVFGFLLGIVLSACSSHPTPEVLAKTLVLDADTRTPLAGVRVACYREDASDSFTEAVLLAEATTDERGNASIRVAKDAGDCHWIFDKTGYAVREIFGAQADPVVDLQHGRELRGRLLDPRGQPCAGVNVEAFLGCGHSPAVRRVRTNASGEFVFDDLAPTAARLWFQVPGAASTYFDLSEASGRTFVTDPGVVIDGQALDQRGRPLEGAVVRSVQQHRGPRAVTGADGRFQLVGVAPGEGLVAWGPDGTLARLSGDDYEPGADLRIRLGTALETDQDGRTDPGVKALTARVRVTDADTGEPVTGAGTTLRRLADGRVFWGETDAAGYAEIQAPAGEYELRAGEATASHVGGPTRERLRAEGDLLTVAARRQPLLELNATGVRKDASVALVLPAVLHPLDASDRHRCHLPADVPAFVRVTMGDEVRMFPVGPLLDGRRRANVRW